MPNGNDIPKGAVVVDDIPAGAVIDDDKKKPPLASRIWDRTKSLLGLDEGVLFGGSGEAGGVAGAVTRPDQVAAPFVMGAADVAAPAIGAGVSKLGSLGRGLIDTARKDATRLNVPFAGETEPGLAPAERWRDATRLNVPGAGEEPPGMAIGEPWRDATRLNVPYAGEDVPPVRTSPFSKGPSGSFDLPSTVPERSSLPGAGGEAWSMQRRVTPQLQTAVGAGDPGAVSTAMRLNPTYKPIIIPREAGSAAGTSPSELESIRASSGLFGVSDATEGAISSPTPISSSGIVSPKGAPTPFQPFQGLRPEVQQMATPSGAAKVPDWVAGQRDFEMQRLKDVLRNPNATEEERRVAQSQLDFHSGQSQ